MRKLAAIAALGILAACGSRDVSPETRVYAHDVPKPNYPRAQDTPESFAVPTTRPVRQRAARTKPPNPQYAGEVDDGAWRIVQSTAYCLTGTMANGQRTYRGAVAMNGVPLGSQWMTNTGAVYTVADRIGHSSQFDIAMPGDCAAARAYGRRVIKVRRIA